MTAPYMTKSSDSIRKNTQYNVSKMSPASKSSFAARKNSHSEFISWKNPHSGFSAAAGSISSPGGGSNPPPSDRQLCCEKKFAKRICFSFATLNDGASPLLNDIQDVYPLWYASFFYKKSMAALIRNEYRHRHLHKCFIILKIPL